MARCLKFIYRVREKARMRRYACSQNALLTHHHALTDVLGASKQEYVSELLKALPMYDCGEFPFRDRRKTEFRGMVILPNSDKYQGTWIKNAAGIDVIHGRGVYVFANGSQFVGYFNEGEIIGKGRMIFHNGDIYQGEFSSQEYDGQGRYQFGASHPISGYYIGEFNHNQATGNGKLNIRSTKPLTKIFGQIRIDEID